MTTVETLGADAHILRLMHRYTQAFDSGDVEAFARLFSHGSLLLKGIGPRLDSPAEIVNLLAQRIIYYDGSPRTSHMISNAIIDVSLDDSTATAESSVQVLQAAPGLPLQVILTARYADSFALSDGEWRFKMRTATASLIGDMSYHIRPR